MQRTIREWNDKGKFVAGVIVEPIQSEGGLFCNIKFHKTRHIPNVYFILESD